MGAGLAGLSGVTRRSAADRGVGPSEVGAQRIDLGDDPFLGGDHRHLPSIQAAMASGTRAAHAVLRALRPTSPDDRRAT
jgi:hypothetical protein